VSETTRRAPVGRLRAWQAAALDRYMATSPRDFLAVATPGAGKTTFALTLATELIARGIVDKLTVVCPTEHLKGQWASSAARFGIHIDPDFTNSQGVAGSHFDGVAVTYAQIGSNPAVHAARTRASLSSRARWAPRRYQTPTKQRDYAAIDPTGAARHCLRDHRMLR